MCAYECVKVERDGVVEEECGITEKNRQTGCCCLLCWLVAAVMCAWWWWWWCVIEKSGSESGSVYVFSAV